MSLSYLQLSRVGERGPSRLENFALAFAGGMAGALLVLWLIA